MGCGILAAHLLVAITVTSIFQQRLPKVAWRGIHYLSFPTFFIGLAHGIGGGTDGSQRWALALYAGTAAIAIGLCLRRILWEPNAAARPGKTRTGSPVTMKAAHPVAGGER